MSKFSPKRVHDVTVRSADAAQSFDVLAAPAK